MTSPTTPCMSLINVAKNPNGILIISVEAAIGTGKSTLLRLLQQRFGKRWMLVQEPVEAWQNVNGHNLLEAYYNDQHRFSFSFQTHCVLSRVESLEEQMKHMDPETEVIVLERCWHSDRNTFGEMLRRQNKISDLEWALYDHWYGFAVRNSPTVEGHVYLECNPETSMARLRKRSRSEEVGVTVEYQKELIQRHEEWLNSIPEQERILRINVDQEFLSDEDHANKVISSIERYVKDLHELRGGKRFPMAAAASSAAPSTIAGEMSEKEGSVSPDAKKAESAEISAAMRENSLASQVSTPDNKREVSPDAVVQAA